MNLTLYLFSGEIIEYNDGNYKPCKFYGITFAYSYVEALQKILDDYNEKDIINLTISPFKEGGTLFVDKNTFEGIIKYGY